MSCILDFTEKLSLKTCKGFDRKNHSLGNFTPLVANHSQIPYKISIFMMSLNQYHEKYHNENFQVDSIDCSQSESEVKNFVQKNLKNFFKMRPQVELVCAFACQSFSNQGESII